MLQRTHLLLLDVVVAVVGYYHCPRSCASAFVTLSTTHRTAVNSDSTTMGYRGVRYSGSGKRNTGRYCRWNRDDRDGPERSSASNSNSLHSMLNVADHLRHGLRQEISLNPHHILPEDAYLTVLDAYTTVYRELQSQRRGRGRRQKQRSNGSSRNQPIAATATTKNLPTNEDQQRLARATDHVVEGMVETIHILNRHDRSVAEEHRNGRLAPSSREANEREHNEQIDEPSTPGTVPRTVVPYATVIHLLVELAGQALREPDGKCRGRQNEHAHRSIAVLEAMESDPRLVAAEDARVLQYNKVLQALAPHPGTLPDALRLLDAMIESSSSSLALASKPTTGNRHREVTGHGGKSRQEVPCSQLDRFRPGPGIAPNAKSFALVLGSLAPSPSEVQWWTELLGSEAPSNIGTLPSGAATCKSRSRSKTSPTASGAVADRDGAISPYRRYLEASRSLGVYEGYLHNYLVRRYHQGE
eukprot:jgi/Psemu1/34009/gm1.34009_g